VPHLVCSQNLWLLNRWAKSDAHQTYVRRSNAVVAQRYNGAVRSHCPHSSVHSCGVNWNLFAFGKQTGSNAKSASDLYFEAVFVKRACWFARILARTRYGVGFKMEKNRKTRRTVSFVSKLMSTCNIRACNEISLLRNWARSARSFKENLKVKWLIIEKSHKIELLRPGNSGIFRLVTTNPKPGYSQNDVLRKHSSVSHKLTNAFGFKSEWASSQMAICLCSAAISFDGAQTILGLKQGWGGTCGPHQNFRYPSKNTTSRQNEAPW